MSPSPLKWRQDGYLWFAHAPYGMWMIELRRGWYFLRLDLDVPRSNHRIGGYQDFGTHKRLRAAMQEAGRANRQLLLQEMPRKNPAETYAASHVRILRELAAAGWAVSPGLKIPHATSPDGMLRFWFRPQAVWLSKISNPRFARHDMAIARSMWVDSRGADAAALVAAAERW